MRFAFIAAAAAALAGCASPAPQPRAQATPPRLVVFMAVDGLPQRQLLAVREQLAPDGLRRFLERGTWFTQAFYGHAVTQTAPGHATMLTGASPHRSGIIANEWRDPATGEWVYCVGDAAETYLEHDTAKLEGTSPRNLRVETVGDTLKRVHAAAKVISISGKDRAAILPAGKTGTAYAYRQKTGFFASTTYYMQQHPPWVREFNAARPADRYFGAEWKPLLAETAYAGSVPDSQPWYAKGGWLPKVIGGGPGGPDAAFHAALLASPYADELTLAFARAAIAGEGLGRDDVTDILVVSFSAHDYINHAYSAESRLAHDHLLRLDRMLQQFFAHLDETIGRDRYVAVLTADHGAMPAPELSRSLGRDAGRIDSAKMVARMNAALAGRFGEGRWVRGLAASGVLFDHALMASRGVPRAALEAEGRRLLLAEPGIAAVTTRTELERGDLAASEFAEALRRAFDAERSPDLQITLKPYWMFGMTAASTHGTPYAYDAHVPLMFYGPAWVGVRQVDARVDIADIAPTLAGLLAVPVPAGSEGKPLPLGPAWP